MTEAFRLKNPEWAERYAGPEGSERFADPDGMGEDQRGWERTKEDKRGGQRIQEDQRGFSVPKKVNVKTKKRINRWKYVVD